MAGGSYQWRCQLAGATATTSTVVRTKGGWNVAFPRNFGVAPLDPIELGEAIKQYQKYVAGQLAHCGRGRRRCGPRSTPAMSNGARAAWLPAQLTWERVGAAYGSFGDLASAIDGGPDGLPDGVNDPAFTGLRRVEYGLWHGQSAAVLAPIGTKLSVGRAHELRQKLPALTANPKST